MQQELDDRLHWYKDAIIYELHIKAFCDSNGDGIGDFEGLLTKLDYLQELGVTAIWVLPFYPSPQKDDGYDIADYYAINPNYGTVEHFKRLLEEAHKRDLKIITELVINHTSDQHPWFQRARQAPRGSTERNYYVWTDDPNQYKDVRIIFQDYEGSNWTWDPVAGQYYWHRFFHHQPDLNYDSPEVQEEILKVLSYWCDMGVDGFRLDAIPYLFEREGTNGENLPETHDFLKRLRKYVDEKHPGTVFLAEANMWPEDSASYFGNGDECHMNYHFPVMPRMFMSVQREDRHPITDIFDQTPEIPETCQWALFLRNHDELTLEMVTDEERDYMYRVYAKDPKAKINLGIRHRLAPLMDNDRRKIELMNSLLFSMKGTPVIYYGDEIGMGDNFYLGDRNGVRTPMQWSPDRNGGFSSANPHSLYLPVIMDPEYHYEAVNVELQRRNTSSLFWFMKRIINMRRKYTAFGRGDMKFLPVDNPKLLAFTRTYQDETILVLVNLSKYAQASPVDLKAFAGYVPIELFSQNRFPAISADTPYFFTLGPHSFFWFALEPVKQAATPVDETPLRLTSWKQAMDSRNRTLIEVDVLPGYMDRVPWFIGRDSAVNATNITQHIRIELDEHPVFLCLVEVQFNSGLPQTFQLPITFVPTEAGRAIQQTHPHALLTPVQALEGDGYICDATYLPAYQKWLISHWTTGDVHNGTNSVLHFVREEALASALTTGDFSTRWHADSRKHTSLSCNNRIFLKLYRKVENIVQPDLEITKYLTKTVPVEGTPAYLGSIDWMTEKDSYVLGMAQPMLENHGDGETFMLERTHNFIERLLAADPIPSIAEISSRALTNPIPHQDLSPVLQVLVGSTAAEFCQALGKQLAALHKALIQADNDPNFGKEAFSLHYQRSLYSGLQTLVRETFEQLDRRSNELPDGLASAKVLLLSRREEILSLLRRVYEQKIDVFKSRIHGHLLLGQVLMTGKGLMIHDFGGRPSTDFGERRLKRSPLRDAITLVRSIYATTYKGFLQNRQVAESSLQTILPYAGQWAQTLSGFFLHAYFEEVKGSGILPENERDRQVLLETFLVRGALLEINDGWQQKERLFAGFKILQSIQPGQ